MILSVEESAFQRDTVLRMKMRTDLVRPDRIAYSVEELADALGLSKGFVWNEIRSSKLPAVSFGRRVLVLREDLDKYIKAQPKARALDKPKPGA